MLHAALEVAQEQGLPPFEEPLSRWPLRLKLLLLLSGNEHLLLTANRFLHDLHLLLLRRSLLLLFLLLCFRLSSRSLLLAVFCVIWLLLPLVVIASLAFARASFFLFDCLLFSVLSSCLLDYGALLRRAFAFWVSFGGLRALGSFGCYLLLFSARATILVLLICLVLFERFLGSRAGQERVDGGLSFWLLRYGLSRRSDRCLFLFRLSCWRRLRRRAYIWLCQLRGDLLGIEHRHRLEGHLELVGLEVVKHVLVLHQLDL